ncbi:LysR family transcriptional regulator [Shewanella atlantica]|uniref:LysR family transcriptional regulator n=1 Tax=Shewanella atlantica TaxID=271099 RepID=A0A3S0KIH6_9GAMM|nr:LysR family transcriptional regulator [Shewanella atlantica]RTR31639.1 LysR family transcriptional regulator [Shewanella atlantica]
MVVMSNDYNLLRLLLVLNETRQTVQAAKALNVSQPTISVMLKKLREQFNDELFVRSKTQLEPTPKCLTIIAKLPDLLEQMEQLYLDAEVWNIADMSGELKLLLPSPLMAVIGAPLIGKLTKLAPKLTVECAHWGHNAVQLLERDPKAWGISYLPMDTNKVLYQRDLGYDKFMLIMRKGHPLQDNTLTEVLNYPICVNTIPGYTEPSKAEMLIKKYDLDGHINLRCSDMSMMLKLVKDSDFICVATEKCATVLGNDYRYEGLPKELYKDTFRRSYALFTHQRNRHNPLTDWLEHEILALMNQ